MASQPLPYVDISPGLFASRLLHVAASVHPPCSAKELAAHLGVPKKRDWILWQRGNNLQSEDITIRTKTWMMWTESLIDLLFTHTLIDFAALKTGRSPTGRSFAEIGRNFEPSYLWLRPEDVWRFLCELMAIPVERWCLKDARPDEVQHLEEAVKRWERAFLYPRHDLPEVASLPLAPHPEASVVSDHTVYRLERALTRLFAWLDLWQKCPYDTVDLLLHLGKLARVYYGVYVSLSRLFLQNGQTDGRMMPTASAPSPICVKFAARLVYLMIGKEVSTSSRLHELITSRLDIPSSWRRSFPVSEGSDEVAGHVYHLYLRDRLRTALQQSYRLIQFIDQLAAWRQTLGQTHGFLELLHGICDFWRWHATEVLSRILIHSPSVHFEDFVPLSTQLQIELEARVRKYLLGRGGIKRYENMFETPGHRRQGDANASSREGLPSIEEWFVEFSSLPYDAAALVLSVNKLQEYVWACHDILVERWLENVSSLLRR